MVENISRIKPFDFWRGISIMLVVFGHLGYGTLLAGNQKPHAFFRWLNDFNFAFLGVRIFFVLSGFLITRLLLTEYRQTGTINYRSFLLQRILRIFPVYYTFLITLIALNGFGIVEIRTSLFIKSFLYGNNFSIGGSHPWVNHAWSLSVEEQFYFLWPLFLISSLSLTKKNAVIFFLMALSSLSLVMQYTGCLVEYYDLLLFGLIINIQPILVGSFFAYFFQPEKNQLPLLFRKHAIWIMLCGLILVVGTETLSRLKTLGWFTIPFGSLAQSTGIAMIICSSIFLPSPFSNAMVCSIGLISYSLYVWQQIFLIPAPGSRHLFPFPYNLGASFLMAIVSYKVIEQPINRYRKAIRRK